MSQTAYARDRGVQENAIRTAVQAGHIKRGDDGLIESEQADADWYQQHLARLYGRQQSMHRESGLVRAKIAAGLVKMQLTRLRLSELAEAHVARDEVASQAMGEALDVLEYFRRLPEDAAAMAAEIGADEAAAASILAKVTDIIVGDLEGLAVQLRDRFDKL